MVKEYICEKCGKVFSQKGHFMNHQKRKKPCKPIENKVIEEKVQEKLEELSKNGDIEIKNKNLISNNKNIQQNKTMRYLGNKSRLSDFIYDEVDKLINKHSLNNSLFDAFGGTGCISQLFNQKGYNVISNDINKYSYCLCYSRNTVKEKELDFSKICDTGINGILKILNNQKNKGFVYYNYSPNTEINYERKYFTNENAEIIDGIRKYIEQWLVNELITNKEYNHLISILIESVSLISNIPGTYGAFLNKWDSRALNKLELKENIHNGLLCKNVNNDNFKKNVTYNSDIRDIISNINTDILYLDPPYNERDYSVYYHVLETICKYDNPELKNNKTGTKVNQNKSNWCNKKKCKDELSYIISNTKSKVVIMSYNNEGIIKEEDIVEIFSKYGKYSKKQKQIKRFKCSKTNKDNIVYEYLHILEKNELENVEENVEETSIHKSISGVLYNMCCIEGMKNISDKSVDMICCDLPYGLTECKWDTPIDLNILWKEYDRILKPYGNIILFGQQPFTSRLVSSNYDMFKYSLIWKKSKPGGFAQAPYKVLCEHEDILVFSYGKTASNAKHKMTYNPQGTKPCNIEMKGKTGNTSHRKGRKTQKDYVQTTSNYPRSILEFKNEGKVKHPTQKPLLLIDYLIKTFSNENDLVLDNCMGSGTTSIACIKNNRRYIGYEKDKKYYDICVNRIDEM